MSLICGALLLRIYTTLIVGTPCGGGNKKRLQKGQRQNEKSTARWINKI